MFRNIAAVALALALAHGCSRSSGPRPRIVNAAAHAAPAASCDSARTVTLAEEAAFRIERLERDARIEASIYYETSSVGGMHVECPNAPVSEWAKPGAGVKRVAQDPDELAYQTAACEEIGGRVEEAISTYEKLRAYAPRRIFAVRATVRLGGLYARVGRLGDSAARLEEYAARYAGEKDATDALADAVAYRAARGEETRRRENEQTFVRVFARNARVESVARFLEERRLLQCRSITL